MLLSSLSWATHELIQISITNSLATGCHLIDDTILFGHVSDHTQIPKVIHPDETATFTMRHGPNYRSGNYIEESIILTYKCQDEQEITLFSSENMNYLEGRKLDVKGMWANYKKNDPIFTDVSASIDWVLTYY